MIFALGIGAQWLAFWIRVPPILLLLVLGFVAGPVFGLLDPDVLFGDLLLPVVSLSVALILFEGGLSLRIDELREVGGVVYRLISVGVVVTWLLTTVAAFFILGLGLPTAVLLGSVLVVTGPTVVQPLLQTVRPNRRLWRILKWEGITIDPLGALLAVFVFEAVRAGQLALSVPQVMLDIVFSLMIAGATGALCGIAIVIVLRFHLVPDRLINPLSVTVVLAAVAVANALQAEAGLAAATVAGIVLANQDRVSVRGIQDFQANIQVLILSGLFILLAARVPLDILRTISVPFIFFLLVLIFVVRPLSVIASTIPSSLSLRERAFVAWMAPRGIVAAAVASVFAVDLSEVGVGEPERLVSLTFMVIVGTVLVYGLTTSGVAKLLDVRAPPASGFLIVGAHPWARAIASALNEMNVETVLADTDRAAVRDARLDGFRAVWTSALSPYASEQLDLAGLGIGRLLALTASDSRNGLAAVHYSRIFGRRDVFQLAPQDIGDARREAVSIDYRGRVLFGPDVTFEALDERFADGAEIKTTSLTEEFTMKEFRAEYGEDALPLFVVSRRAENERRRIDPVAVDVESEPRPGQTLISLVRPSTDGSNRPI